VHGRLSLIESTDRFHGPWTKIICSTKDSRRGALRTRYAAVDHISHQRFPPSLLTLTPTVLINEVIIEQ